MAKKIDRIWGVDRYEHSDTCGELVVPTAYLWKRPGAKMAADNLTGALAHDTQVEVLEKKVHDKRLWCKVQADVVHEGGIYHQEGWLAASLLFEAGANGK